MGERDLFWFRQALDSDRKKAGANLVCQLLDMESISIQPSQMNIIFLSLRTYQGINSPHAFQFVWVRKIDLSFLCFFPGLWLPTEYGPCWFHILSCPCWLRVYNKPGTGGHFLSVHLILISACEILSPFTDDEAEGQVPCPRQNKN